MAELTNNRHVSNSLQKRNGEDDMKSSSLCEQTAALHFNNDSAADDISLQELIENELTFKISSAPVVAASVVSSCTTTTNTFVCEYESDTNSINNNNGKPPNFHHNHHHRNHSKASDVSAITVIECSATAATVNGGNSSNVDCLDFASGNFAIDELSVEESSSSSSPPPSSSSHSTDHPNDDDQDRSKCSTTATVVEQTGVAESDVALASGEMLQLKFTELDMNSIKFIDSFSEIGNSSVHDAEPETDERKNDRSKNDSLSDSVDLISLDSLTPTLATANEKYSSPETESSGNSYVHNETSDAANGSAEVSGFSPLIAGSSFDVSRVVDGSIYDDLKHRMRTNGDPEAAPETADNTVTAENRPRRSPVPSETIFDEVDLTDKPEAALSCQSATNSSAAPQQRQRYSFSRTGCADETKFASATVDRTERFFDERADLFVQEPNESAAIAAADAEHETMQLPVPNDKLTAKASAPFDDIVHRSSFEGGPVHFGDQPNNHSTPLSDSNFPAANIANRYSSQIPVTSSWNRTSLSDAESETKTNKAVVERARNENSFLPISSIISTIEQKCGKNNGVTADGSSSFLSPKNINNESTNGTSVEKKSIKKKNTSNEASTVTKVKKTKKTKKYEEKENISVHVLVGNQTNDNRNDSDYSFYQITDDNDELSNVSVQDLKLTYYNETMKRKNDRSTSLEEPVPSSVPVGTLLLSFAGYCDQSKKMSNNNGSNSLKKTYSLGDMRSVGKIQKRFSEDYSKNSKSGFGKFDQLIKKPILHVRSSDATKAQQQFSQNKTLSEEPICKACNKAVFAMEQIKAERQVWHKNCFRCRTCSKQLTVDIYSSHEGELYCKPHFRNLFKPKVVVDDEEPASDRPDLGLEELSSLNVMSRFQVFEKPSTQEKNIEKSPVSVKRSQSILSKLARFQAKGMDVGVSSDIFNGIDYEESSSSEEEQNGNVVKSNTAREKPIAFNKMDDVKKTFERGQMDRKEERREERRQELQQIRSRLFMGKQGKMKEAYEQAVAESEKGTTKRDVEVKSDKARSIKEKFERGEVCAIDGDEEDHDVKPKCSGVKEDEFSVFEAGISKKSRSIFQQLDANVAKSKSTNQIQSQTPINLNNSHEGSRSKIVSQTSSEIVRSSDPIAEVPVETAEISSKFKFFQTYKPPEITRKKFRITPPREGEQKDSTTEADDNISTVNNGRCANDIVDDEIELKKSQTTAKMLSFFRQMEESQDSIPDVGRKPLKKFTPPPDDSSSSDEESTDESEEPSEANSITDDIVRASYKVEDEFLKQAQNAARAKALKEKFEHWEPQKQSLNNNTINDVPEGEQTKSLRAKFESLRSERQTSFEKPRPKVNRFI